jgi:hypothetical protein
MQSPLSSTCFARGDCGPKSPKSFDDGQAADGDEAGARLCRHRRDVHLRPVLRTLGRRLFPLPAKQRVVQEGVLVHVCQHCCGALRHDASRRATGVQIPTFNDNSGGSLALLFGSFSPILYVLIVYALLCINVFNFYGAFMAVVTTIQPFGNMRFGSTQRAVV